MAFSSRAEALLHEAKRISIKLDADLLLIHAGEKNEKLEFQMQSLLEKVGIDERKVEVVWEEGTPIKVLSEVCRDKDVDLLILGAIQNEAMLRYYIGSVARKISRRPPCSLLLVTHPNKNESRLKNIVVSGVDHAKTKNTIGAALSFSSSLGATELTIVEEVEPSKLKTRIEDNQSLELASEEREKLQATEDARIRDIIDGADHQLSSIKQKCIFGREGYSIGHFAEIKNADLLVMNSPDKKLGFLDRFFPHHLEFVLSDMPCDLMIVHPN